MAPQLHKPPPWNSYRHRNNSPRPNSAQMTFKVVSSMDELMQVFSIRSAVYLSEQSCPHREEFDGNDFCCSHLIGYYGEEPASSLRIRYFADFAKMERLAVRREFRRSRLAFETVRAGVRLCRKKGYRRLYGHAREELTGFWSRFGATVKNSGRTFVFSDQRYMEMIIELPPDEDAITVDSDPYIIIRPEGQWEYPGILERSALRGASEDSPLLKGVCSA